MRRSFIFICTLLIGLSHISNTRAQEKSLENTINYKTEKDILYYDKASADRDEYIKERCRLDLYYPVTDSVFATVVWFHGGGLRSGNRFVPAQLKNQNIAVAAVNYRLHPKVTCPVYIEDAAASVAWVFNNIQNYGGNPKLIFLSGHSAGGYLASMLGLDKKWLAKHDIDADRIAGLIPFSGHTITHMTIREERGIAWEQPVVDEFAPLFHVRPDAPPLVLITGDRNLEILGRYEENAYMMRMMKVAGHKNTELYEIQGFDHGGMAAPAHILLLKNIKIIMKTIQDK